MLSKVCTESPVKPAVEIAEERYCMLKNKIMNEMKEMKTERGDRRAKSNIADSNLEQTHLQMSSRRLRSSRKSDAMVM